jgi:hypothetical protein
LLPLGLAPAAGRAFDDADGDLFSDAEERAAGSDPANASKIPDPFAGMQAYAGETHVHPASAWAVYAIAQPGYDPNQCRDLEQIFGARPHSHVWCDRVYDRGRALGLDWMVETHHVPGMLPLLPDPRTQRVLSFWKNPANAGFADPFFRENPDYRYPTDPRGFPDYRGGFTDSEWRSLVGCADAKNEPGRFVAFAGIEWSPWGPMPRCPAGQALCGGHKTVVFLDPPEELCSMSYEPGFRACPSETLLYEQIRRSGGVANVAHPKRGRISAALVPHDAITAPGGIDDSVVKGIEIVFNDAFDGEEDLSQGWRPVLRSGLKLHPVFGADCHNRPPGTRCGNTCGPGGNRGAPRSVCFARELSRAAIVEAMREHRCYWTSGGKPVVRFAVEGRPMGATLRTADVADPSRGLRVWFEARRENGGRFGSWDLVHEGRRLAGFADQPCDSAGNRCSFSGFVPVEQLTGSLYLRIKDGPGPRDRRILTAPVWIDGPAVSGGS